METRRLSRFFKALSSERRLRMLREIARGERNVGAVAEEFGITPAVASHHLKVLEGAGFLHRRRRRRWVSYRLDRKRLRWGIVSLYRYLKSGG